MKHRILAFLASVVLLLSLFTVFSFAEETPIEDVPFGNEVISPNLSGYTVIRVEMESLYDLISSYGDDFYYPITGSEMLDVLLIRPVFFVPADEQGDFRREYTDLVGSLDPSENMGAPTSWQPMGPYQFYIQYQSQGTRNFSVPSVNSYEWSTDSWRRYANSGMLSLFQYRFFPSTFWYTNVTEAIAHSTPCPAKYIHLGFDFVITNGIPSDDYQGGYDAGYTAGYEDGNADGYQVGYEYGLTQGNRDWYDEGYEDGYTDGYTDGNAEGLETGRTLGYEDGYTDGVNLNDNFGSMILSVVSAPFQAISNMLNFEIFGINLAGIVFFLITSVIIVFIIRRFSK